MLWKIQEEEMRIAITGVPHGGKTYTAKLLSAVLEIPYSGTDDVMHLEWSEGSRIVSEWFDKPGPWIIEGVVVPRAIRKWRARFADDKPIPDPPFDKLIVLRGTGSTLLRGQEIMGKQVLGLIDTYKDWIGERWIEI
jgi:hypothetical protein